MFGAIVRSFINIILASVVLTVLLIVIVPFFIPKEYYVSGITELAKKYGGVDIVIEGNTALSLVPKPTVTAEKITITDPKKSGSKTELGAVKLQADIMSFLSEGVSGAVAATYNGVPVNVEAKFDNYKALQGGTTFATFTLGYAQIAAEISGDFTIAQNFQNILGKNLQVRSNDVTLNGEFEAKLDGKRPAVSVTLNADRLKLNELLALAASPLSNSENAAAPSNTNEPLWDTAPIKLDGLDSLDADIAITVGALEVKPQIILNKLSSTSSLKSGVFSNETTVEDVFGGSGRAAAQVKAAGQNLSITKELQVSGLALSKLLNAFSPTPWIEGEVSLDTAVNTSGNSVAGFLKNLAGNGTLNLSQGVLHQIKNPLVQSLLQIDGEQIPISKAKATYTIASGVVKNDDLVAELPVSLIQGSGRIDMNSLTIDYTLVPKILPNAEQNKLSSLKAPVKITGSLLAPNVSVNAGDILMENVDTLIDATGNKELKSLNEVKKSLEKAKDNPALFLDTLGKAVQPKKAAQPEAEPAKEPASTAPAKESAPEQNKAEPVKELLKDPNALLKGLGLPVSQ